MNGFCVDTKEDSFEIPWEVVRYTNININLMKADNALYNYCAKENGSSMKKELYFPLKLDTLPFANDWFVIAPDIGTWTTRHKSTTIGSISQSRTPQVYPGIKITRYLFLDENIRERIST